MSAGAKGTRMSRDQGPLNRKSDARKSRKPAIPSKRSASLRIPLIPVAAVAASAGIVLLIAYLIIQASSTVDTEGNVPKAALDDSPNLPGNYAPWQGVQHLPQKMTADYTPIIPYCDGVPHSGIRDVASASSQTATATSTSVPATAQASAAGRAATPATSSTPQSDCYNSNPPSSGRHFGVQRPAEIAPGISTNIPPDPDVYPHDIDMPREAIAHIAEHSGVFVGFNCPDGDQVCLDVVALVEDITNSRIDNHGDRVTMMYFSDLPFGEIGLSSITRWDRFHYTDFGEDRVERFIAKHACRYDAEGFC